MSALFLPLTRVPFLFPVFVLQGAEVIKDRSYRELDVPSLGAAEIEIIEDLEVPGGLLLEPGLIHVELCVGRDLPDLGVEVDVLGLIKQTPLLVQRLL